MSQPVRFDDIIPLILEHEGGAKITKDKDDPGGTTKYGISQKAYPTMDIESLTEDDAKYIYFNDYWNPSKASHLPLKIRYIYFDMVVNMGKSRAVKILQRALNSRGSKLKIDGGIGKNTLNAAAKSQLELERLRSFRVLYYADLVNRKPKLQKYWYGWYRRSLRV